MLTIAVVRRTIRTLVVLSGILMMMTMAHAQNAVEDAIQQLSSTTVKGYLQPFIDGVGADLNSGVYHSAYIGTGFSFKLELVAMGTLIGDAQKVYSAVPRFRSIRHRYKQRQFSAGREPRYTDRESIINFRTDNSIYRPSRLLFRR